MRRNAGYAGTGAPAPSSSPMRSRASGEPGTRRPSSTTTTAIPSSPRSRTRLIAERVVGHEAEPVVRRAMEVAVFQQLPDPPADALELGLGTQRLHFEDRAVAVRAPPPQVDRGGDLADVAPPCGDQRVVERPNQRVVGLHRLLLERGRLGGVTSPAVRGARAGWTGRVERARTPVRIGRDLAGAVAGRAAGRRRRSIEADPEPDHAAWEPVPVEGRLRPLLHAHGGADIEALCCQPPRRRGASAGCPRHIGSRPSAAGRPSAPCRCR